MFTLACLAFFLAALVGSGLWLLAVDRRALRPLLTSAVLVIALGGYAAVVLALRGGHV
ncbi:hypothetical protein SAMN05216251_108236 [Actinacidiphila alni]|uniref:Uncharacterized protein n=1 Tax=Actinacidiphila alni TaxID=380248 RepID=A0A1I2G5C1_9ACTN|nr:hypothetical protein [Actinacidiphila alni]SFF11831.1 hypothetical protein SAMN05216251_108236 [Actinacidiphila alni]